MKCYSFLSTAITWPSAKGLWITVLYILHCNATLCYLGIEMPLQHSCEMVAERKVAQKKDSYITKSEALCNRLSEA